MEYRFPLKGKNVGVPTDRQSNENSRDLNNVRPRFDGEYIGGQRPGVDKRYPQQIGGTDAPITVTVTVTVVD